MSQQERLGLQETDPGRYAQMQDHALNLGLDLQGGMHVVLEVDKSELDENSAKDARERALEIIRNRVDEFGVAEPIIQAQGSDRIMVELPAVQDPERARNLIGKTAQLEFKLVESPENTNVLFSQIDRIAVNLDIPGLEKDAASDETVPTDPFFDPFTEADTAEADATSVETDTTELAEDDTSEDTTADTTDVFSDLEQEPTSNVFTQYLEYNGTSFNVLTGDYFRVNAIIRSPEVLAVVPSDNELAWNTREELIDGRGVRQLYLLKSKTELSGAHLTDARPNYDQYHSPVVDFTLDREGGQIFGRVTGPNIGKPLAILLDGRVESAPTIQSRIRDQGQITLGGQATFFDAKDLATILRAGALPAPVRVVESNVIGPTLGKDSIEAGQRGLVVALVLVMSFMAIYYKLSGLVADFVLLLNVFFLLAVMAALGATLTLPGIAGIILTMGITVDANVLVFERIREELRSGKTVRAAIDAGYDRATISIVDSNITILIAAGVLYYFGTGPIKGFAVTLGCGIMISLYTALIVGKTIFHYRRKAASLSI
jgi:protein-export membrane protein SecD